MILFDWLRPAPFPEKIQDDAVVKKQYKYWRLRTFYGMYIGYAFYYFTRKSLTFAMPSMLNEGFSLSELGMFGSILSITYGFSKFLSGIIGDRSNPRYFMSLGLIFTGICNICFGFSTVWASLALFWGLNAWFQGWGWPGCAKLLTHWYSQSERGRWWSVWNTSHNVGGALIPLIAAFCAHHYGWRFAMVVPGALCIFTGFFLINRLRDVPESLGLPPIEKFKCENGAPDQNTETISLSVKEILFKYVLCNEFIWLLAFSYFFVYIIRIGFNDWSMVYLIKFKGYSEMKAASCILCFEVGGFLGSLCAGWVSDLFFASKRNPINFLFIAGALFSLMALHLNALNWFILDAAIIFSIGFFIFGPQMLIGMAAAELTHKGAAATSSGFAGCFAYIGAAVAGAPLGFVIHSWGWDIFYAVMFGCGFAALGLLLPLWSIKSSPQSLIFHSLAENKEKFVSKIWKKKENSTGDAS